MNHNLPQVRILHLSDLHFGPGHRFAAPTPPGGAPPPGRGIPSLAESVCKDLESEDFHDLVWHGDGEHKMPLLLALTGDLTQTAAAGEFQQADACIKTFLANPVLSTRLGASDVSIVPGNHDVIFDEADMSRRWSPYCNFLEDVSGFRVRPSRAPELTRVIDRSESDGLVIAEINSCVDVRRNTDEATRGHVDQGAIASLVTSLKQIPSERLKGSVKVALVHHHPIVLPSLAEPGRGYDAIVNSNMLLALLREFEFHLVLHGHKHFPHTFSYDTQCAWTAESQHPMMVVSGGSAGAGPDGLPTVPKATNTYNLIALKWNPKANHGRVRIVTRGLVTHDLTTAQPMPAPLWYWHTLKVDDRVLSSGGRQLAGKHSTRPYDKTLDGEYDERRREQYKRLRGNMLMVDVLPSLDPEQAYEARVRLVVHRPEQRHKEDTPVGVEWSAGPMFPSVKVCDESTAPDFAARFSYWGGMLIQARLHFPDGAVELGSVYAPTPGA